MERIHYSNDGIASNSGMDLERTDERTDDSADDSADGALRNRCHCTRWQDSQRAAYTWLRDDQRHPYDEALAFFRESICERCEVWVAVDPEHVIGLLALDGATIDHLFVDPERWGAGVGSRLLQHAKALHPRGLDLVTLVRNERARRFYEAREFVTTKFGTSPPPESEPDVYYRWSPSC